MSDVTETLLNRLRSEGVGCSPEINRFWWKQLKPLKQLLQSKARPAVAELRKAIGYNPASLPPQVRANADLEIWPEMMRALESDGAVMPTQPIPHDSVGHLLFLSKRGLLQAYLDWLDERRLHFDMNLGRFFWYREKLKLELSNPARAYLEVGAGSGQFALMILEAGLTEHVVIVDLPEMLLNAALSFGENRPDLPLHLDEAPDFSLPPAVWLLTTSKVALVPARSVDIAVNINSFMEMAEDVRDFYIDQIYRVLRPEGLFFNVNRRQHAMHQKDGSKADSNPLLYPYRNDDEILEWEVDAFQMTCKSERFFSPPSYAISRLARVA